MARSKNSVIAFLLPQTARAAAWLGPRPVANWCLNHLQDVRGIDRIICCITDKSPGTWATSAINPVEIVTLPVRSAQFWKPWLRERYLPKGGIAVYFNPVYPFLPASRIEACVEQVRDKKFAAAIPARKLETICVGHSLMNGDENSALLSGIFIHRVETGEEWRNNFAIVPVRLLESLCVADDDTWRVAEAMVATVIV